MSPEEVEKRLQSVPQWCYSEHKLHRRIVRKDFRDAMALLVRIAFEAEALDHHPEIRNVYKTIDLALTTHDAGNRVSEKDFALALRIERILAGEAPSGNGYSGE